MRDTVPYQAYRSKRHSHTPSNSNSPSISPPSPPGVAPLLHHNTSSERVRESVPGYTLSRIESPTSQPLENKPQGGGPPTPPDSTGSHEHINSGVSSSFPRGAIDLLPETELSAVSPFSTSAGASTSKFQRSSPHDESQPAKHYTKRASIFRHVPSRTAHTSTPSSPLGPQYHTPAHSRNVSVSSVNKSNALLHGTNNDVQSTRVYLQNQPIVIHIDPALSSLDSHGIHRHLMVAPVELAPATVDAPAVQHASSVSTPNIVHSTPTSTSSLTSVPQRISAPYRPGFQPKGVYRPLTDKFIALRQAKQEGEGDRRVYGMKMAEKRKLERRLEKLIAIHFPLPSANTDDDATTRGNVKERRVAVGRSENRRVSSLVDFDIRSMTIQDAGGLWRGIFGVDEATTIRTAEQRITPWQDDGDVSKCPLCSTSFHPLTNRKHHCRLCGQIVCSLSPKLPQRPKTCSLLFVVDSKTRKIEEVSEGVDYGVKRRKVESNDAQTYKGKVEDHTEDDKFLRGVRICRTCRPVLLHQQHQYDVAHVPMFVRLYKALISLEHEIEEYVPQFQELIFSLSHNSQPTKEASSMRKRLMEAFAQYDVLAKRIRKLPCPNGLGSSQDRVQVAVMTRANLFLQMNMVPLQSLSTPTRNNITPENSASTNGGLMDADSKVALALQPLLEQEALLESFVEEAQAQRKFEDVKTLKGNLGEIRAEIERVLANAKGRI